MNNNRSVFYSYKQENTKIFNCMKSNMGALRCPLKNANTFKQQHFIQIKDAFALDATQREVNVGNLRE